MQPNKMEMAGTAQRSHSSPFQKQSFLRLS